MIIVTRPDIADPPLGGVPLVPLPGVESALHQITHAVVGTGTVAR